MPAAAVIPTPRVSMMDAAVKESVVVDAMKNRGLNTLYLLSLAEWTGNTV